MPESAVCCISTYSHLFQVLCLVRSIRKSWNEQPEILVLLLDHQDMARPGFQSLSGIHFLSPAELRIPDLDWLTLKFTPLELACSCKPFLVSHALSKGYDTVWYVDSDILFLSDPAEMRRDATAHDMVVTPHIFSPIPARDAWTRPTMGHLAGAGLLNAGLFTARRGETTMRFLAEWAAMTVAPGACIWEMGNHQEQHAFNWIQILMPDVFMCRDKRMNVAYWNMHERPLRWAKLDGGPADQWMLDGEPISCFHFSGFNWGQQRLSTFDHRTNLALNINLHALAGHYDACLENAERDHYSKTGYGFATVGNLVLNDGLRHHLKMFESRGKIHLVEGDADNASRVADGLLSVPGNRTLLPKLLEEIFLLRPDLQNLIPGETLYLPSFLKWCNHYLESEYGARVPLFHSSFVVAHRGMLEKLTRHCARILPDYSGEKIRAMLCHDRLTLTKLLCARPDAVNLIRQIEAGNHLAIATNPAIALRFMIQMWPGIFKSVPALGKGNLKTFRTHVKKAVRTHFIWPEAHRAYLDTIDPEASLARVLSVIRRQPHRLEELRRHRISRTLISLLIPMLAGGTDFDAADLALIDWYLEPSSDAAAGFAPTLRQSVRHSIDNFALQSPARSRMAKKFTAGMRTSIKSSRSPLARMLRHAIEGGDNKSVTARVHPTRIAPLLASETDRSQWQGFLAWWATRNKLVADAPHGVDADFLAALDGHLETQTWDGLGGVFPSLAPAPNGLNIFGYFKSPIGLGQMTRGLAAAHALNGNPYRGIVLTNMTMADDFRLEDLYPDFAFHFPRNLVVTYPHINYNPNDIFPARFFRGRENIAYIAWEQRDMHPEWCKRLDHYERLFALSQFAADSVANATGRECQALPCVVEMDAARAKQYRRRDFDLPEDAFVAGFIFDASSSVERKNPLGAAQALLRAFRGRSDVVVAIKVTNGDRPEFRHNVEQIGKLLTEGGIRFRLITRRMQRAELEGLMAQFDLYLSLHRSEGFGYTIAEAMWLGVPVVATAYSGNMDFMRESNSYPVRFQECVVRISEGPFQPGTVWADPDLGHAAELCDQIYGDRNAASSKAVQGAMDVQATVSVAAVAARLQELLSKGS